MIWGREGKVGMASIVGKVGTQIITSMEFFYTKNTRLTRHTFFTRLTLQSIILRLKRMNFGDRQGHKPHTSLYVRRWNVGSVIGTNMAETA